MGTRRITYIVALTGSAVFYSLYPFWISRYIFVLIIMMIPFDLLLSLPGMLTKRVALSLPRVMEQGAQGAVVITTYQQKWFPAGRIKAKLRVSGDDFSAKRSILCSPDRDSKYELDIDSSHSGVSVFEIKRIRTTSLFGLFATPIRVNRRAVALILPAPIKPPNIVSLPRGVILRPKPGGGFSEDSELRPYRPGDPIRTIHWKLSAKHDSIIVREPLAPPAQSRLIIIERWNGARERDITLGRFRWLSDYLLKWELAYCVKLGDDGQVTEISGNEDFLEFLYRTLDDNTSSIAIPTSVPARFSWVFRLDAKEDFVE